MATVTMKVVAIHKTEVAMTPGHSRQTIGQVIDQQIGVMAVDMDEDAELLSVAVDLQPEEWRAIQERCKTRMS